MVLSAPFGPFFLLIASFLVKSKPLIAGLSPVTRPPAPPPPQHTKAAQTAARAVGFWSPLHLPYGGGGRVRVGRRVEENLLFDKVPQMIDDYQAKTRLNTKSAQL
jgi:hypothetical protein